MGEQTENEEIVALFLEEAEQHFEAIEKVLSQAAEYEVAPVSEVSEAINSLFRAFHTIKGNAAMLGFEQVQVLAHELEAMMDPYRKHKVWLQKQAIELVSEGKGLIEISLKLPDSGEATEDTYSEFLGNLSNYCEGLEERLFEVSKLSKQQNEHVEKRDQNIEAHSSKEIKIQSREIDHLRRLSQEIEDCFSGMEAGLFPSDRSKYGPLFHQWKFLKRLLKKQNQLVDDVSEVEVDTVFKKLPKIVSETAQKVGKKVELKIEAQSAQIDQMAAATVQDPLIHIVRNAIDHGIEDPETRKKLGKPETGLLTVKAYTDGGFVNIEVQDDGQGVDPEKVRQKAVNKGIISEKLSQKLSEKQLVGLLMAPGFSTRSEAGMVSGRGVGMDVVKDEITKVRGQIGIRSKLGEETMVRLRIPHAKAEQRVLWVRCGKSWIALPKSERKAEILQTGEGLPDTVSAHLGDLTSIESSWDNGGWIKATTRSGEVTLVVDEIGNWDTVLIKPLDSWWSSSSHILGGVESKNGKPSLIFAWNPLGDLYYQKVGDLIILEEQEFKNLEKELEHDSSVEFSSEVPENRSKKVQELHDALNEEYLDNGEEILEDRTSKNQTSKNQSNTHFAELTEPAPKTHTDTSINDYPELAETSNTDENFTKLDFNSSAEIENIVLDDEASITASEVSLHTIADLRDTTEINELESSVALKEGDSESIEGKANCESSETMELEFSDSSIKNAS